jgi:hypothetical protein
LKFRFGRQEFGFDLQRFVSDRDGPKVWDAWAARVSLPVTGSPPAPGAFDHASGDGADGFIVLGRVVGGIAEVSEARFDKIEQARAQALDIFDRLEEQVLDRKLALSLPGHRRVDFGHLMLA